jgi:HNH endonuclease
MSRMINMNIHYNAHDLSGQQFGQLTVVSLASQRWRGNLVWTCCCKCGSQIDVPATRLRTGTTRSCGCLVGRNPKATGSASPHWIGGRHVDKENGYVKVYVEPYTYQLEHILVMEQHLGRLLLPHEEVHHKNGIRSDNDLKNLELWSTAHPHGQRVEDKTQWAIEWLQQYKPEIINGERLS